MEHGTNYAYTRGCRCRPCTMTASIYQRDYKRRVVAGKEPQPEKVTAWKAAVDAGLADSFCDRIIKTRDVPIGLLRAIVRA